MCNNGEVIGLSSTSVFSAMLTLTALFTIALGNMMSCYLTDFWIWKDTDIAKTC